MSSEEYLARLRPSLDRQRSSRDELLAEEDAKEARSYALMNMSENIRNRQYYVALDSSALPTAGTRDEIPERHWYRYTWYRDLANNHVVTGVLENKANLQRIEHRDPGGPKFYSTDPKVKYRVPNTEWVLKQVANGRSSVPEEFQYRYTWENDVGTLVNTKGLQAFYDEGPLNIRAKEDAKEASSYALKDLRKDHRDREYYVAPDGSALPSVGTRDEIPERHWYRYTWYRDLSNNHVVTGLLYNVLGLREIAHNRTTRDPNVKYRVPNTDWVLKQVAYGRTSVPEEFQFRYMWEGDVGTLVNTMGLQAFYDEGPTTRPPAPPQPPQPPPAAGVKNWQSQVQGLQSYINLERDTVDMYKRAIATFTNQMLASMNAGNFEAASGHQKDATEHLDKLISAQAKITDLERQKRLLLDTHMASPPPRPWERFEPGGPDDPAQPLYRAAGSQR
jgi:hypothetical protein